MAPQEIGVAGIDELLSRARAGWQRLTPLEAWHAVGRGALLVDTRTPWQRLAQGELPGALVIDRTVLEWRLDPSSAVRIPEARPDLRVVVACRQGYSSSLAVRDLRALGIDATDIIGGVEGWSAAGLPTHHDPVDERH